MHLRKEFKARVKSDSGMTLLETLITTVMIALVSAVVAVSIPTVQNAYEKTVLAANAEVLLNTAVIALRNELGTARNVTSDGMAVSFYNENLNSEARIRKAQPENPAFPEDAAFTGEMILYQRYANGNADPLLSGNPYHRGLYVTYESASCEGGIVTFHNLEVKMEEGNGQPLTGQKSVSVRTGG